MSEENTALGRAVEAMIRIIEAAEETGRTLLEEKERKEERAEIERVAKEARTSAGQ